VRRSRIALSVLALSLPVLALSACGGSSGGSSSSVPAPTTSSSSSSAPTSGASSSSAAAYSEAFCAAFTPLLDLPDPTGPTDPTLDEALMILDAAKAAGDELAVAQVDAIIAVYEAVKDGSITIPVQADDPLVADGAAAIQQIIFGCNLMPTG